MRNSDFSPSRFESQQDAVNLICGSKTRQNVENVVGLITTAGRQAAVQVSLTPDLTKILGALHRVQLAGESDIVTAIQVARLALRHRQNKRQEQRIVLFVGSPVGATVRELTQLGGELKKNKIALDIVNFGEETAAANEEKLTAFHKAVCNHDNSTIVTIPPGTSMLSEVLSRTPIVRGAGTGDSAAGGAAGTGGGTGFDWVDPDVDPELALALRLSMETAEQERTKTEPSAGTEQPASGSAPSSSEPPMDPEMAAALKLSMEAFGGGSAGGGGEDDDEELQRALQMSMMDMAEEKPEEKQPAAESKPAEAAVPDMEVEEKKEAGATEEAPAGDEAMDATAIASMLLNLPGIDAADPEFQEELKKLAAETEDQLKKGGK